MLYYYGPTMGKTHACKFNSLLVDFDDLVREDIKNKSKELNLSVRDFKKSAHFEYYKLIFNCLIKCKYEIEYENKIVMVSNAIAIYFHDLFDKMLIPSRNEFIRRNMQRGGTEQESAEWYDNIMIKYHGKKFLTIEDRFVTELHP